jgi:hypothetical protein
MNPVKLTKKDKVVLDTFNRPWSRKEICERIDELTQNMVKFIWEDIQNCGAEYIMETHVEHSPAKTEIETHTYMVMGGGSFSKQVPVTYDAYDTTVQTNHLEWLRFSYGTAMVGLQIGNKYYIHKKFFDYFITQKKISLEQYWFLFL